MYLKSLELLGFKSFGKKARLDFTTPITAIVGPNGSGKSNVAEGFRFALGEQRMTQLRGKRTSDLIWNGSTKVPKSQRANVKLVFDNTSKEKLFDIDFDEVAVERIIHRDASTDYKINGSPARLKDIVELLSGAHIGASGHHIISQGETDLILNVAPKERRGMIEDALGLKVYQYKKEESVRKLEKVEVNKKEVESLRREIKPHIKFLSKQMEKVKKAREMRDELKNLYKTYLACEKKYIDQEESRLKGERKPVEASLSRVQRELQNAKETLTSIEGKEEASKKSRELDEKLEKLQQEKEGFMREAGRLEGALDAEKQRVAHARAQAEEMSRVQVMRSDIDELKGVFGIDVESSDISELKKVLNRVRDVVTIFVQKYQGEQTSDEIDDTELKRIQKEHREVLEKLKVFDTDVESVKAEIKRLQDQVTKERESFRGAERATYELKAEESELRVKESALVGKEKKLLLEKEELEQEEKEARILVGTPTLEHVESAGEREAQLGRKKDIERLKIRLEDAGGGASSEDVAKEYEEVVERDAFLERELADLGASAQSLEELIGDLEKKIMEEFKEGVTKINKEFQRFFGLMFGGGNASLSVQKITKKKKSDFDVELADEIPDEYGEEETEEGVEIQVSLPRKKIQGLQMLSGGERALTSIALLFAMSQVNPPPFLVLDETDAALDEANSKRYGDMIEELAKKSQLILISHNRETMSRAGVLYGVTMGADGVSQLLSVGFEEAVKVAK